MKIAIDLTPLYGRKRTGVEMYAIDLYRALLTTKHLVIPIFHCKNELDGNANSYIIPYRNRLWLDNISLSRAIRKIKVDIVIFPIFPPPIDIYFSCKSKIYQTIHDTASYRFYETLNFAFQYYYQPKQKVALKYLDGIITVSKTVKSQLKSLVEIPVFNLGENISVEYKNALGKVNVQLLEKWGLKVENYYISVSTIEPRKNFCYLLEILIPILKKQGRKLVLVGRKGWGNNERLKHLIESAGDYLIFTGYVTDEELFSLYSFSYAFALLSKDEGFGRTPFEAVACGCKRIILSDIDIFHETFEGNATFLPLEDVERCRYLIEMISSRNFVGKIDVPYNVLENNIGDWIEEITNIQ